MRLPRLALALLALLPLAAAASAAPAVEVAGVCTPPVSQFGACVTDDCVILDGPAMHGEVCPRELESQPLPGATTDGCVSSGTVPELRVCVTHENGQRCVFATYGRVSVFDHCTPVVAS